MCLVPKLSQLLSVVCKGSVCIVAPKPDCRVLCVVGRVGGRRARGERQRAHLCRLWGRGGGVIAMGLAHSVL